MYVHTHPLTCIHGLIPLTHTHTHTHTHTRLQETAALKAMVRELQDQLICLHGRSSSSSRGDEWSEQARSEASTAYRSPTRGTSASPKGSLGAKVCENHPNLAASFVDTSLRAIAPCLYASWQHQHAYSVKERMAKRAGKPCLLSCTHQHEFVHAP
jgi:hypothetical protein